MTQQRPDETTAVIDETQQPATPSHQGSAGGDMAREIGQRDEAKTAEGGDPLPTSVDKRDKPDDGDLPTRLQTRK
jgi:hypothetical protein